MMWSATSPAVQPSQGESASQAALDSAASIDRVSPVAAIRSRSTTSAIAVHFASESAPVLTEAGAPHRERRPESLVMAYDSLGHSSPPTARRDVGAGLRAARASLGRS